MLEKPTLKERFPAVIDLAIALVARMCLSCFITAMLVPYQSTNRTWRSIGIADSVYLLQCLPLVVLGYRRIDLDPYVLILTYVTTGLGVAGFSYLEGQNGLCILNETLLIASLCHTLFGGRLYGINSNRDDLPNDGLPEPEELMPLQIITNN